MNDSSRQSFEELKDYTRRMETHRPTSPMFSWVGWPLLSVGLLVWLIAILNQKSPFILYALAAVLVIAGLSSVFISFISANSEAVEEKERLRKIRERSTSAKCIYLEGSVPEGKGTIGRCRLFEFDMVDLPYCLYCKEYQPLSGNPQV